MGKDGKFFKSSKLFLKISTTLWRHTAYHSRPTVLSTNKHNKSEDTAVKAYSINIIRLNECPQIALKMIRCF